jgi:hypothetical protein
MHATYKTLSKYYAQLAAETRKDAAVGSEPVDVVSTVVVNGTAYTHRLTATVTVSEDREASKPLPYQTIALLLASKVNADTRDKVQREIEAGDRSKVEDAKGSDRALFDALRGALGTMLRSGATKVHRLTADHVSTVNARERGIA